MFQGSMVALVTPMHSDGSVDYASLAKLVEFHCENGTDAIVSVGTTGESATLEVAEHAQVIKQTVALVNGRIPVIAGTGANSTAEAIHLTRAAQKAGADACLLVSPYYNKPTQEGLYQHHKAIAEAVDIAQILYNVPGRTAVDMLPATVERLSHIENIVGIKEATGDLGRAKEVLELIGDRMQMYTGDDATAMECILLGAVGDISVSANVAPKAMHEMCKAARAGNRELAEELDAPLRGLHQHLFCESNPIPVKWALAEMGYMGHAMRLPLTKLDEQYHGTVRDALKQASAL
jgi:4-hydroxy-tetrahydrodipicolinate synthase